MLQVLWFVLKRDCKPRESFNQVYNGALKAGNTHRPLRALIYSYIGNSFINKAFNLRRLFNTLTVASHELIRSTLVRREWNSMYVPPPSRLRQTFDNLQCVKIVLSAFNGKQLHE